LSLRKSPARTPAFLEANRRNAQKSTGPCTRRGKAQSCLNRLKAGARSRVYRRLWFGLLDAPPGAVERMAGALLTREQSAHPAFAELVNLARWAESVVAMDERQLREHVAAKQKAWETPENEPPEPAGAKAGNAITIEQGRGQSKKMLEIDVGSRKVIENKGNEDMLSCHQADILGNSAPVLTENSHLGAIKITFSMRFNCQCAALAMPRCEPQNLPDAHYPRLALDVTTRLRMALDTASDHRYDARQVRLHSATEL